MTSTPVKCRNCRTKFADARRATSGVRLRVVAGQAFVQVPDRREVVRTICPNCGATVTIPGRLVIVQD